MKKLATMALSVGLIGAMVAGGSLAYLTSEDSKTNVMTLGNVKIKQIEQQRSADGKLVGFKDGSSVPAVYDAITWDANGLNINGTDYKVFNSNMKNVVDKIITVQNTGKSDAFVRTVLAFESNADKSATEKLHINVTDKLEWLDEVIEVDGSYYEVAVYTYDTKLAPKEISAPSLMQFFWNKDADNEDFEIFGDEFKILAVSQAVQSEGFETADNALDTAFGELTRENAEEWFTEMETEINIEVVSNLTEWETALDNGESHINLAADISAENSLHTDELNLDLQGNALTVLFVTNTGDLTISNGKLNAGSPADYSNISIGTDAETTYTNVDIISGGGGIGAAGGAQVEFNSGSVVVNSASTSGRYNFYAEGEGTVITINGGEFSFSKTLNQKRAYIYASAGTTVYVNGGTFGPASTRSGYTPGILGEGTVIITGGTFGFDPSTWVADGYEAVKSGNTWTVSAK